MAAQQDTALSGTDHAALLARLAQCIPPLTGSNYKGQHGKIGVLGGCREYTGAPYFAAISATKVGADMTYVFCTESAATVIKGYSPELIVMPFLPESCLFEQQVLVATSLQLMLPWVRRLSCLVVGPGLGDDPMVVASTAAVLRAAREADIPLLVDGSGINIVVKHLDLVQGYRKCLLTPNIAELGRLAAALGVATEGPMSSAWQRHVPTVAKGLAGPVLVSKGPGDVISDGTVTLTCSVPSSPKRCGGQGDVLAGVAAAFLNWALKEGSAAALATDGVQASGSARGGESEAGQAQQAQQAQQPQQPPSALHAAAYAACCVVRSANMSAYAANERAMVAGDIIPELRASYKRHLEGG